MTSKALAEFMRAADGPWEPASGAELGQMLAVVVVCVVALVAGIVAVWPV